ncbi:MAG: hypothetical protein AB7F99_16935 [Vicinamibacterales bacterium]
MKTETAQKRFALDSTRFRHRWRRQHDARYTIVAVRMFEPHIFLDDVYDQARVDRILAETLRVCPIGKLLFGHRGFFDGEGFSVGKVTNYRRTPTGAIVGDWPDIEPAVFLRIARENITERSIEMNNDLTYLRGCSLLGSSEQFFNYGPLLIDPPTEDQWREIKADAAEWEFQFRSTPKGKVILAMPDSTQPNTSTDEGSASTDDLTESGEDVSATNREDQDGPGGDQRVEMLDRRMMEIAHKLDEALTRQTALEDRINMLEGASTPAEDEGDSDDSDTEGVEEDNPFSGDDEGDEDGERAESDEDEDGEHTRDDSTGDEDDSDDEGGAESDEDEDDNEDKANRSRKPVRAAGRRSNKPMTNEERKRLEKLERQMASQGLRSQIAAKRQAGFAISPEDESDLISIVLAKPEDKRQATLQRHLARFPKAPLEDDDTEREGADRAASGDDEEEGEFLDYLATIPEPNRKLVRKAWKQSKDECPANVSRMQYVRGNCTHLEKD